ncbi:class I SAM-dependent methyltransferase [Aneurinibacillus danicus]|uniref:SAM-dependent methyltransferase n=1 Tax=Aneurinibacillus danicus TaxID=267746 RepID=A0A511V7I7_9BACL|nr:class I SAM-dependent methyltransferase [Aneurinibacillus danicus]GEN34915.1 SAM-dependent methyltransferase [Aneurinibacillus danicus]
MNKNSINTWNADLYDDKISFVSEYGKEVVRLLNPQEGEHILDIGCGTGDLTREIADAGALPLGIDLSSSMIEKARQKYPDLSFIVADASTFHTDQVFDAAFSNAALHWMKQPEDVIASVWHLLKPGGRFVAEFGGKGNVQIIIDSITEVLSEYGISAAERNPWYFPSIGEYSMLLEQQGFHVRYAVHFARPTPLHDGERGLTHWLESFSDDFFHDFNPAQKETIFQKIIQKAKPHLYRNGKWTADYKRLRIAAIKE